MLAGLLMVASGVGIYSWNIQPKHRSLRGFGPSIAVGLYPGERHFEKYYAYFLAHTRIYFSADMPSQMHYNVTVSKIGGGFSMKGNDSCPLPPFEIPTRGVYEIVVDVWRDNQTSPMEELKGAVLCSIEAYEVDIGGDVLMSSIYLMGAGFALLFPSLVVIKRCRSAS
jgi:hypothetical protein